MGFLSGLSKAFGSSQKTKSSSKIDLPDYVERTRENFYKKGLNPALGFFSNPANTQFRNSQMDPNSWFNRGLQGTVDATNILSPSAAIMLNSLGMDYLSGKFLDPSKNETLQGAIRSTFSPLDYNFQQTTIPGITSNAVAQGAWGSNRGDISQAVAATELNRIKGDIAAQMSYNEADKQRQLQLQSPALLREAIQLKGMPSEVMLQASQMQEDFDRRNWNDMIQAQLMRFQPFMGMFGQIPSIEGSTEKSTASSAPGIGQIGAQLLGTAASAALPFMGGGGAAGGGSLLSNFSRPLNYSTAGTQMNPVSFWGMR